MATTREMANDIIVDCLFWKATKLINKDYYAKYTISKHRLKLSKRNLQKDNKVGEHLEIIF